MNERTVNLTLHARKLETMTMSSVAIAVTADSQPTEAPADDLLRLLLGVVELAKERGMEVIDSFGEPMELDDIAIDTPAQYDVVVGNIGYVYSGTSLDEARHLFDNYVEHSKLAFGRAAGESVTLLADGEIVDEHDGDRLDLDDPDFNELINELC